MVDGKLKEKISDAIIELHDSFLTNRDFNEFPIVLELVIKNLIPIDWLLFGLISKTGNIMSITTNPCLPFDWNEKYAEIDDIDHIKTETLKLPVGGTFRYNPDLNHCDDQMEYVLEYVKKHTDTTKFLTLHTGKTDHCDSAIGFYRTGNDFRFTRDDQQILDYLSPVLVSISNTMMFYSEFDYKRVAIDALRNDSGNMSIVLDEFLRVIDLPLHVETFLSKYFQNAGRGSLPIPISGWIRSEIAPSGRLGASLGSWRLRIKLPDIEILCQARTVVTEMNRTALLIRIIPHQRDIDFSILKTLGLTEREVETLSYLPLGYSNRQIAAAMQIEEITVKKHLKNVAGKLHAYGKTETLYKAIQKKNLLDSMTI